MYNDKNKWDMVKMFFMKKEEIDKRGRHWLMRSFLTFGFPLDVNGVKYKNLKDRQSEQQKYVGDFQDELVELMKDSYNSDNFKS